MTETKNKKRPVVIIGGGITGLAAAWELQQAQMPYVLLEAGPRWGGKVTTERRSDGQGGQFVIDGGPESFITRKPEVWDLAHEAGLAAEIQPIGSETSHMFVLDRGEPRLVPLNPLIFAFSPLMSLPGKLRMLAEPFIPPRLDGGDESLGDYVTRRLGKEALDQFIGPILAGIYNTDPYRQSILVSSPVMREMEAEYGGLFKAALGKARQARARRSNGASQTNGRSGEPEPKKPRFISFASGAQVLVDGLAARLAQHPQADLRLNSPVRAVLPAVDGWRVELENGQALAASAVIAAAPANQAARLLAPAAAEAADMLAAIRHENIGTATLIYREADAQTRRRIHGLMVPRRERRKIDAITFTSLKLPGRAPQGYRLVRVFFGGGAPEMVEIPEAQMLQAVQAELKDLLGISAAPLDYVAFRWPHSFPQADVGHLERVEQIQRRLPEGIALAGSSYRGIGVPDCVRDGRQAARAIGRLLQS
ncbi:MAG: protoporphyrinogen oxidase [Chloroflexota bacterium]